MIEETVISTGVLATGGVCGQCLATFGLDPTVAGALAVVVAVGVRLVADAVARHRAKGGE